MEQSPIKSTVQTFYKLVFYFSLIYIVFIHSFSINISIHPSSIYLLTLISLHLIHSFTCGALYDLQEQESQLAAEPTQHASLAESQAKSSVCFNSSFYREKCRPHRTTGRKSAITMTVSLNWIHLAGFVGDWMRFVLKIRLNVIWRESADTKSKHSESIAS